MTLLEKYTSPDAFLSAAKNEFIASIRPTARFGLTYAQNKYTSIIQAANDAKAFGHAVSSNFKRILLYIRFIRQFDNEISSILSDMHELVDEIGDFSAFRSPKQLFVYFGLDPVVKQSGKFNSTKISMSKRGSRITRRVIHTMALISISKNKDGSSKNSVLR